MDQILYALFSQPINVFIKRTEGRKMFASLVSKKLVVATIAALGFFVSGVGLSVPVGAGTDMPLSPCGVAAAQSSSAPASLGSCEEEKNLCMDMHRAEDVRGNGYIPADAFRECMKGYWDCRGLEG